MNDPRETMDDRGMILQPDFWPQWPLLPIKKKGAAFTDGGTGFIVSRWTVGNLPEPVTVYIGIMPSLTGQKLSEYPTQEYATVDAVLADNWIVD